MALGEAVRERVLGGSGSYRLLKLRVGYEDMRGTFPIQYLSQLTSQVQYPGVTDLEGKDDGAASAPRAGPGDLPSLEGWLF